MKHRLSNWKELTSSLSDSLLTRAERGRNQQTLQEPTYVWRSPVHVMMNKIQLLLLLVALTVNLQHVASKVSKRSSVVSKYSQ